MVDSVNSGYKIDPTAVTITDLATLGANTYSVLSSVINHDTTKELFADFIFSHGTLTLAPVLLNANLYLIPMVDVGTTPAWEPGVVTSEANENYFVGSFTVVDGTAANEFILRNVSLPPGKFKLAIRGLPDVSLVGGTLEYRTHNYASQ